MDQRRKESLLSYLISGQFHFSLSSTPYFLSVPSPSVKTIAQIIYQDATHKCRFENWHTYTTAFETLVRRGIISPNIDAQIKNLETRLDDLKVDLYKAIFRTSDEKRIRREIKLVRDKISELENLKSEIYHLTLEGYTTRIKYTILIAGSIYYGENMLRVFDDEEIKTPDITFVDSVVKLKNDFEPDITEIRELSRTHPWKSMWTLGKPNPFNKPIFELSDAQQSIMIYSNMYDNIRESIDCPSDNIINDDDMCDGWLILQNRKREKEQQEKQTEDVLSKTAAKAQEVFLPARNKEDATRINSMNDMSTKIVMEQRKNQIKNSGVVKDGDLIDNRIKKQNMTIQQIKERKGK